MGEVMGLTSSTMTKVQRLVQIAKVRPDLIRPIDVLVEVARFSDKAREWRFADLFRILTDDDYLSIISDPDYVAPEGRRYDPNDDALAEGFADLFNAEVVRWLFFQDEVGFIF